MRCLCASQAIQQLGAVTSSELTDYIMHTEAEAVVASAAVAAAAAAAALMVGRADGSAGVQGGAASGGRPPGGRSQRGRGGAPDAANPLKALLQASSMHELFAVLQASHQFVVRAADSHSFKPDHRLSAHPVSHLERARS